MKTIKGQYEPQSHKVRKGNFPLAYPLSPLRLCGLTQFCFDVIVLGKRTGGLSVYDDDMIAPTLPTPNAMEDMPCPPIASASP
ncbi:MAG: hypothetical protein KJ065_22600 [Anaerolineae bacterium]|nr:hypothetical protein [Anaerolineae bacterium]